MSIPSSGGGIRPSAGSESAPSAGRSRVRSLLHVVVAGDDDNAFGGHELGYEWFEDTRQQRVRRRIVSVGDVAGDNDAVEGGSHGCDVTAQRLSVETMRRALVCCSGAGIAASFGSPMVSRAASLRRCRSERWSRCAIGIPVSRECRLIGDRECVQRGTGGA